MLTATLFTILIISLITDIKYRRIYNVVTFPAMLIGLIGNTVTSGWDGLFFSLLGLLTGLGLLLIPYALGAMAAGDVKLLMAIGAIEGAAFTFGAFLYVAIIGGIIALGILIWHKELLQSLKRIFLSAQFKTLNGLSKDELHHAYPYGAAIVLGTLCFFGVGWL
ncbi:A24 family peptidase [Neobacillus muris]|uniref:A24 family peptidase n=1 Tax=Neobacillus muris TaxID=2941334 RepID=UPI00204060E3|nr:A24 family peptidase [Neobacillus muris]